MKSKLFQYLLWPNLWVGIFSVLVFLGVICLLGGHFADLPTLKKLGFWLGMPLVVAAMILVFVIFPILIRANRKHLKTDPKNQQ